MFDSYFNDYVITADGQVISRAEALEIDWDNDNGIDE